MGIKEIADEIKTKQAIIDKISHTIFVHKAILEELENFTVIKLSVKDIRTRFTTDYSVDNSDARAIIGKNIRQKEDELHKIINQRNILIEELTNLMQS